MVKSKKTEDNVSDETGRWNIAKDHSFWMIAEPLYECSQFQKICYHGTLNIIEDFTIDEQSKVHARIKALERYITNLLLVISNTKEHFNKNANKEKFEFMKLKLKILYRFKNIVKTEMVTQSLGGSARWIEINEEPYDVILQEVISINELISGILTEENLIYYNIPEFDIDKAKEDVLKTFAEEA